MKLDELRDKIEGSASDAWAKLDHSGYLPKYQPLGGQSGVRLDVDTHHTLLTYRDDVDIQLAYGLDADFPGTGSAQHHPRTFDWAEGFLHPLGRVVISHYFYRGHVVDETLVLSFDGAWLPFPERVSTGDGSELQFSGPSLKIARLLHAIDYPNDADEQQSLMHQSGLRVVE